MDPHGSKTYFDDGWADAARTDGCMVARVKPPEAGRLEIWDARVTGLVLRITPAGAATWSVRARTADGKRTRPKIGTYPAVSITEARKRALATTADIQDGGDPVATRRALQAERQLSWSADSEHAAC